MAAIFSLAESGTSNLSVALPPELDVGRRSIGPARSVGLAEVQSLLPSGIHVSRSDRTRLCRARDYHLFSLSLALYLSLPLSLSLSFLGDCGIPLWARARINRQWIFLASSIAKGSTRFQRFRSRAIRTRIRRDKGHD